MEHNVDLIGNIDAHIWAKEFIKTIVDKHILIDEDLMISWFANAIMTGYDNKENQSPSYREAYSAAFNKNKKMIDKSLSN